MNASDTQHEAMKLERRVASTYRALGGEVQLDVALAGNRIDVLVREKTPAGTYITKAIECKAYPRPVGAHVVNAFAALAMLLRERGLIDESEVVSSAGFTVAAREVAGAARGCGEPCSGRRPRSVRGDRDTIERQVIDVTVEACAGRTKE